MTSLILGIILGIIVGAAAIFGVIAAIAMEGEGGGILCFICCGILLALIITNMISMPLNSNPIENYERYNHLITLVEECKDDPYSETSKLVIEEVEKWNEDYISYTSKIGNAWDGRKYNENAFKNCSTIDYWEIIYNEKEAE